MSQALRLKGEKKLRANELKWGLPLVEAGWTLIPSTILEHQATFGLDSVDLNILDSARSVLVVSRTTPRTPRSRRSPIALERVRARCNAGSRK